MFLLFFLYYFFFLIYFSVMECRGDLEERGKELLSRKRSYKGRGGGRNVQSLNSHRKKLRKDLPLWIRQLKV